MNLFQKDLSFFQDELIKNRWSYKNVKEEKEKKELEKNNLSLEIFDVDTKVAEYKIVKNRRLRSNKKISEIKQKRFLVLLILTLVGLGTIGSLAFANLLLSLNAVLVFGSLGFLTSTISEKKIRNTIKKRNELSGNKTIKELNSIIETLEKESNTKLLMQKGLEDEINLLNSNLEKIDLEASKIYDSYKFVLDVYQGELNKVDSSISDEEVEQIINKQHANVIPMIVKKLFNGKNV